VDRKDLDRQTREEFNRFQEGCVEENTHTAPSSAGCSPMTPPTRSSSAPSRNSALPSTRTANATAGWRRRASYLPHQVCTPDEGRYPKDDLQRLSMLICEGLSDSEREQVHVGTVHAFKGREADVVVLLDAVERRFPKVHPDWVFGRIFGDSPGSLLEDERRLFYVACSRAISTLVIITERLRESPFLNALRGNCSVLNWDNYEAFCPSGGDWIILVGNASVADGTPTMARSETLKARGYQFGGGIWPHWRGQIPAKHSLDWIVENLPRAPWLPGPDGVEIRICSSDGAVAAKLVLVDGKLVRQPLC